MLKLPSSSIFHNHGYSSFKQDPLIVVGEENATSDEKEVKKTNATLGRNGCNPSSETSTGGSSTSSSYSFQGHWLEEDKIFPLKKRRIILESGADNAIAEKTEQKKANATAVRKKHGKWKCVGESDDDGDDDYEWGPAMDDSLKISKNMVRDGSRCKRSDGRGWRCSEPSVEGHSMCENHLHKSRAANKLRAMRKHNSSKGWINGQEANHNLKTRHEIKSPFPHPDIKSCFSSPKSKGSSFPIRAMKRCRRWNGKAWRCSEPAVEGHSLCEHHLTGSRKQKNRRNVRHPAATSSTAKSVKMAVLDTGLYSDNEDKDVDYETDEALSENCRKVDVVKARSISSLLDQKS